MTTALLTSKMRELIGNPTMNEVADKSLVIRLSSSLSWLSGYLRMTYMTQTNIDLVADEPAYQLPKEFLYMSFVTLGADLLAPTSTWQINSGGVTTSAVGGQPNWLTAIPAQPNQYAIEGRSLILNPPPDASAVLNTPTMTWRYLATGTDWGQQSEIGIGRQGPPSLSEMDEDLLIYDAAVAWLAAHISPDNQQRLQNYQAEIQRRLPEAKRRWSEQISDYAPSIRVDTSGRFGTAR